MKTGCFVITLDPKSPGVRGLLDELARQGIAVDLFSAVDGRRGVPPLEPGEEVDQQKALLRKRAPLNSSEVGCYLSHYRLI
ncbi:MAG: glycosyltransferase family 25 protein, partial [Verrucomicrobia bacterium]|nr:glycosyltransferase family 25 protein [Verrucomicrobiota bacterium]